MISGLCNPRLSTQIQLRHLPQTLEKYGKVERFLHLHRDLNGAHCGFDSFYVGSVVGGGDCPALEQKLVNSKKDHNITRSATVNPFEGMTLDY